jgi:hypothetical protein
MDALLRRRGQGRRRAMGLVALAMATPLLTGASHTTTNFTVDAPTADSARRIGEYAESCRKTIAQAWLGHELPAWKTRCPVRVKLTDGEAGGLTSFGFASGRVADQVITLEGRLDRILASALPHEVTHTVFAAYFGGPMPRWADEGASLLSEDDREIRRHEQIVLDLLGRRGDMPLQSLFRVEEYPKDLMGFYGQGYSVSRFLIEMGGRPRFLKFVRDGSRQGWDSAAKEYYGLANCHELDRAWRAWHKVGRDARASVDSTQGARVQAAGG